MLDTVLNTPLMSNRISSIDIFKVNLTELRNISMTNLYHHEKEQLSCDIKEE